jgi:hypothetical protein
VHGKITQYFGNKPIAAVKGLADVIWFGRNAASLLSSINDLIKTRNGIGIVLISIGAILMIFPCWFVFFKLK